MSKWTLFPADTDQHTVEIADHVGRVEVTVGRHVAHLDPTEARHMAGALLYAASCVETGG
jgi:hypothetical protein